jgi:CRP/FNR family transcriptional activator FtrB
MLAMDEFLGRLELFEGLDAKDSNSILGLAELRSFSPNEDIVDEGQPGSHLFCVLTGLVRLTKRESSGREVDVCVCEPGDAFGEYLVPCEDGNYEHGAKAAEFTEVVMFDLAGLRALANDRQAIQRNIMRIMARHLLGAFNCIAGDRLHTAAQRVANYFLSRCPATTSQVTFRLPYQKRVLAGKLGLAPEALSRAFAALAEVGVDVRGRTVRIESMAMLRLAC